MKQATETSRRASTHHLGPRPHLRHSRRCERICFILQAVAGGGAGLESEEHAGGASHANHYHYDRSGGLVPKQQTFAAPAREYPGRFAYAQAKAILLELAPGNTMSNLKANS